MFFMTLSGCEMSFNHGPQAVVEFPVVLYCETSTGKRALGRHVIQSESLLVSADAELVAELAPKPPSLASDPLGFILQDDASVMVGVQKLFEGLMHGRMGGWGVMDQEQMNEKIKPSPMSQCS